MNSWTTTQTTNRKRPRLKTRVRKTLCQVLDGEAGDYEDSPSARRPSFSTVMTTVAVCPRLLDPHDVGQDHCSTSLRREPQLRRPSRQSARSSATPSPSELAIVSSPSTPSLIPNHWCLVTKSILLVLVLLFVTNPAGKTTLATLYGDAATTRHILNYWIDNSDVYFGENLHPFFQVDQIHGWFFFGFSTKIFAAFCSIFNTFLATMEAGQFPNNSSCFTFVQNFCKNFPPVISIH